MSERRDSSDFGPYEVVDSGETISEVFARVNQSVFSNHCSSTSPTKVDGLGEYRRVLERLCDLGIAVVPFTEADFSRPPVPGKPTCLLRHDLDIDVVAALEMARIEHDMGVRSSWYVLHTSPYYGTFDNDGVFHRHNCMRHVYRTMQELDHEIALHTDGLHVYQFQQRDGAQALTEEIAWLRSSGIRLTGTTAHNSWSIYGAENFALFKGRPQRGGTRPGECPDAVTHEGRSAHLQVLDEQELGLTYEANEVFWQNQIPVRYAAIRSSDTWRWSDKQSRADTDPSGAIEGFIDTATALENFSLVKPNEWLVLVVHPVYFGKRSTRSSTPFG